ncbi:MAG: hypothetical protein CM1200mP20_12930 [Pseudomonadota bacterium]|nr:MAG: hypothetical protein CM1200mP20_12930 [Pseudomonadota bacterium]
MSFTPWFEISVRFGPRVGIDEVRCVSEVPVSVAGPGHDRHGDLGEIIIDQVIQSTGLQQLRRGQLGFTPESTGTANSDRLFLPCLPAGDQDALLPSSLLHAEQHIDGTTELNDGVARAKHSVTFC